MQRNRLLIILAVILTLAVLAAAAYLFFVGNPAASTGTPAETQQPTTANESKQEPKMVQVIVALQPIARGSQFVAGSIGRRGWPEGSVLPPDIIADEIETIGKIARTDIVQGQLIVRDMLADPGAEGEAALLLPPGRVGVAYPIDRQSSVAYAIQPGDSVDILSTAFFLDVDEEFQSLLPNKVQFIIPKQEFNEDIGTILSEVELLEAGAQGRVDIFGEGEQAITAIVSANTPPIPRRVAQLTVQAAKVVGIGPWLEEPPPAPPEEGEEPPSPTPNVPDIVTLGVTPQDALVLLWLRKNLVGTEMALRAANEESADHLTEAVTLQYMLTRFNIAVPPKIDIVMAYDDLPKLNKIISDINLLGLEVTDLEEAEKLLEKLDVVE